MHPVICAIDGWDSASGSARAVHVARDLAERFGRPILYVSVLDASDAEPERAAAAALLQHAVETSSEVEADWTLESGHPADRIVALAGEREASFVVVGNHGPRSSLLGSISADVARRASCPVVVVPPDSPAAGAPGRRLEAVGLGR
ncbi:MAG TPA: universal stress protein [Gaiellaceae bacterium]|nr:universal stress protein [Gaiellaceae bacterium]